MRGGKKTMEKEIKQFIELTKNNLENNKECGGWCIRCALSNVLDEFDETNGGISDAEAIRQVLLNDIKAVS